MPSIAERVKSAWNAFNGINPTRSYIDYGAGSSYRPDRDRVFFSADKSIVKAISTRIAIDVAATTIEHVRLDENKNYKETIESPLNNCLTLSANIDQTGRAFFQDAVESMFDEGVVAIDPLQHACSNESHDDCHQQDVGHRGAHRVHHLAAELAEAPDDDGHHGAGTAQREQQGAAEEVDALKERGDDDAGDGREERGQQDGHKDVGGLGSTLLSPVDQDGDGDERQAAGVQHEKHDHRVGGRVLLRVQLLHLLHGLQTQRRGSIVEPQHVGGNVHEDAARDGMTLRDVGKQLREDGTEQTGQHADHAALLAHLHDAQP